MQLVELLTKWKRRRGGGFHDTIVPTILTLSTLQLVRKYIAECRMHNPWTFLHLRYLHWIWNFSQCMVFIIIHKDNKLETFKDALWKLQNFNTQNWKPCTLDLSPCGKRNAVKSRLGHLWIVFYKWYPPLFALSHPFKPLVDYRLLCSQYNTGRTSYSGTSLPKRPAFGPQNSQPFAGFVNNSQRVDPRVSCFIDNVII